MGRYRVAQCYTGPVGAEIVRRMAGHPLMELVGVLVHYPEKVGRDAGELVGAAPNGIVTTASLDEIIALKPDAIIWSGLVYDVGAFERILSAGINLYNGIGAYFLEGQPEEARLKAACQTGQASLCAGGNIPGLVSDVLPLFLSGYTGRIRQVRAWQRNDMASGPSAAQIQILGVGLPPGEGPHVERINLGWTRAMEQSSRMIARGLGVEWEGIVLEQVEYKTAPHDVVLRPSGLRIAKGMAAGVRWTLVARAGGREFFRLVNEQSAMLGLGEDWRQTYDEPAWRVEIDGEPPIVCTFGWPAGTEPGRACHLLNAARAMNVIPRLIEAKPGALSVLDFPAAVASDGLAPAG
jgi:4-hydroxy-tetrahydrodipicolinate reductase